MPMWQTYIRETHVHLKSASQNTGVSQEVFRLHGLPVDIMSDCSTNGAETPKTSGPWFTIHNQVLVGVLPSPSASHLAIIHKSMCHMNQELEAGLSLCLRSPLHGQGTWSGLTLFQTFSWAPHLCPDSPTWTRTPPSEPEDSLQHPLSSSCLLLLPIILFI